MVAAVGQGAGVHMLGDAKTMKDEGKTLVQM